MKLEDLQRQHIIYKRIELTFKHPFPVFPYAAQINKYKLVLLSKIISKNHLYDFEGGGNVAFFSFVFRLCFCLSMAILQKQT